MSASEIGQPTQPLPLTRLFHTAATRRRWLSVGRAAKPFAREEQGIQQLLGLLT
jgi:hypothetical protein